MDRRPERVLQPAQAGTQGIVIVQVAVRCLNDQAEAIRLLRHHGILSMVAFVSGFADESDRDCWRTLRQLISYDPDQIQSLYATPHRWTPCYRGMADRRGPQAVIRVGALLVFLAFTVTMRIPRPDPSS